jgi:hypothetical protein
MLDTRFVRRVGHRRGWSTPNPEITRTEHCNRSPFEGSGPPRLLRTALAAVQAKCMKRTGIVFLIAAALSMGMGSGTSVALTSSPHSLRSFCIDYQDYSTYNPTGVAEWKLELGSVEDLVKEAPNASMKSDLKSFEGFLKMIVKNGGNPKALSKKEQKHLLSLVKKMNTQEKALCPQYQTDG